MTADVRRLAAATIVTKGIGLVTVLLKETADKVGRNGLLRQRHAGDVLIRSIQIEFLFLATRQGFAEESRHPPKRAVTRRKTLDGFVTQRQLLVLILGKQ